MSRAGRCDPAIVNHPLQRPCDLQHVGAAAPVVVGGEPLLLQVPGQHDGLIVNRGAADHGFHDRLAGRLTERRLHFRADVVRRLRRRKLRAQTLALALRQHEGERALFRLVCVLHRNPLPRDLVLQIGAAHREVHDTQRAALPDGLLDDGGERAAGENHLARDVLACVVRIGLPRADIHELGRADVGRPAVIGHRERRLGRERKTPLIRLGDPELAEVCGPAVRVVLEWDVPHVLEAVLARLLLDVFRDGLEALAAAHRPVIVREPADVLEGDVAGDLVDERAVHAVGKKGRPLGTGRRGGNDEDKCSDDCK
jgi:hypothetical protein